MYDQMRDAPIGHYKEKYRALDPELASKRTGISYDKENSRFMVQLFGCTLYAEWPDFRLVPADPERCLRELYGFSMQILTIRFLLKGAASQATGDFKAYRELPWGGVYDANFQGRCVKRLAHGFGKNPDKLIKAAEALGGLKLTLGDVSFDLPFFGGVVCRLILWTPDDEFPPSAQILFSSNTPVAFNAEDLAGVGDVIVSALKTTAIGL